MTDESWFALGSSVGSGHFNTDVPESTRRRAALVVCDRTDADDDARLILEVLGLVAPANPRAPKAKVPEPGGPGPVSFRDAYECTDCDREAAARLKVSTKTVGRWRRNLGLPAKHAERPSGASRRGVKL